MKIAKRLFVFTLICVSVAIAISFTSTYWSCLSAARIASEQDVSPQFFEDMARDTGQKADDLQRSFQKVRESKDNPMAYPGFDKYWLKSFLAWLPIVACILLAITWLRSRAKRKPNDILRGEI